LDSITLAINLAQHIHASQVDKAGKPYIDHPLRVMQCMDGVAEKIVAVLHDAVEDSDLTLEDLKQMGFSEEVVTAIAAITKQADEDYERYLARVIANPIAVKVKIADMTDNMDMSRLPNPTDKDWDRLQKYEATLPKLKAALAAFELKL
jgi:GTP diphosphokinase / guanosine-3',5'-bis(diphosphate) 3'-diphosphatase